MDKYSHLLGKEVIVHWYSRLRKKNVYCVGTYCGVIEDSYVIHDVTKTNYPKLKSASTRISYYHSNNYYPSVSDTESIRSTTETAEDVYKGLFVIDEQEEL